MRQHVWHGIPVWLLWATLAMLGPASLAQSPSPKNVVRSATRALNLSVVVTDPHGQAVKDLIARDFTVLDDGRPQRIAFFSTIDDSVPVSSVPLVGPDNYTNDSVVNGAPPSITILFFDTLNSRWTSQGYGLNRVRDFLRQIGPQDHIGIYVLGDYLIPVHRFVGNSSDIIAAIHRYDNRHAPAAVRRAPDENEDPEGKSLDRFLDGKDNRYRFELDGKTTGRAYRRDKEAFDTQMTMACLEAIARELSGASGRKTLIWVTDGIGPMAYFFHDNVDPILRGWREATGGDLPAIPEWLSGTDVEQMIRLMNNAGIAVYTVDARGLETERLGLRSEPNAVPLASPTDPVQDLLVRTPQPNGDLIALAQRTGGRAFYNRNDLETGIRRALDDARFTYSIAYAPDHNDWKGEWRKIQVKVDRPDVTVLARSGYFALPAPQPMSPKKRYDFLSEIAASPLDSAQLPFLVHISAQHGEGPAQILAAVDIPPQSLATMLAPDRNGQIVGHFEIEFMQIDAKNKLLNATQKQIDADLRPAEYSKMTKGGWALAVRLPAKAGAQNLCVILHDEASDEVGSIHIPLAPYAQALRSAAARN